MRIATAAFVLSLGLNLFPTACSGGDETDLFSKTQGGAGGTVVHQADGSVSGAGGTGGAAAGTGGTSATAGTGGTDAAGGTTGAGGQGMGGIEEGGSSGTGGTSTPGAQCPQGSQAMQEFSQGQMVGCPGTWSWEYVQVHNKLCGNQSHLCSAKEWVALRAGQAPVHHYWTSDNLREWDGPNCQCTALPMASFHNPCAGSGPMHVCAGNASSKCGSSSCASVADPSGNTCCWIACGLGGSTDNEYFGGCQPGDNKAGVLCCLD